MRYFNKFPTFETTDGNQAVDLFLRLKIHDLVLSQNTIFFDYNWRDSDRPDIVAHSYYGDPAYYWVVFYSNNAFDLNYDFPMKQDEFDRYIIRKYGSLALAQKETFAFKQLSTGLYIDYETHLENVGDSVEISAYDNELTNNEAKRKIKLISKQQLVNIASEFEEKLRSARRPS